MDIRTALQTILILLLQNFVKAQIPVGTWRDHLPYTQAKNILQQKNKIFCATPYALFYYNTDDYSINTLSITNGLSDIGTSAINYSGEIDLMVVAYSNANLDFIQGNEVTNLNDIKLKQIQGDKNIYQIVFNDSKVYLACGFGIVVANPEKPEIEDTYYIGDQASAVQVFSISFDTDYIYAASGQGIYYADKNSTNLIDYNTWAKETQLPDNNGKYMDIVNFHGQLFVNYFNQAENTSYILKKEDNIWKPFYNSGKIIKRLKISNNELFIIEENQIISYDETLSLKRQVVSYGTAAPRANDCIIGTNGNLYIADEVLALVVDDNSGKQFESIMPNSPYSNHVDDIATAGSEVWVAGGGRNVAWGNLYRPAAAFSFTDEHWRSNILWNSAARDFVKIVVNPLNTGQIFAGSWGAGVFELTNNELVNEYNDQNSTLQSIKPGEQYIRIGGLALDDGQNLWVTNAGVSAPISVKTNNGDWYSFNYPQISGYDRIGDIIVTQNNNKWVQLANGGGLFAFNDNYTPGDMGDDQSRRFFPFDENGELITKEIFSMAEDKDGVIWVGTDQGVVTYYSPQNVFSGDGFYADRIKLVDENIDSLYHYLLGKEKITAITIDGANRKWFGTENSGVYLMSEDAREEIFHFDTENSPLYSNTITDIAINDKTGEVFIGTTLGLISFKGTATEGDYGYTDAYVYPNPVRENYKGLITVTGLSPDVNVKITDVGGRLVYETTAFGGQAIWNGKNFDGQRVKTGVYLIFCTDDAGEHKKVLKLLFIN